MRALQTVVVGLGRIGWQFHLPSIAANPKFVLVGVVDPLAERRAEAEATYHCSSFASLAAALAATRPDLVVIASPTHFHREQALQAFEAGCDVFCDKPLAASLPEALDLTAQARRLHRKLMVYQPHRARSDVAALQRLLADDLVGPLFLVKRAMGGYDRRSDWQAFKQNGGGMLNNAGSHLLDLLLWLVKSKPVKVSCSLRRIASLGDAEDVVKAVVETSGGTILDIDINYAAAVPLTMWQLFGARGTLTLDREGGDWEARYFLPSDLPEAQVQEGLAAQGRRYGGGSPIPWRELSCPSGGDIPAFDFYDRCHDHFALGEPPFVPLEETVEVVRCIEECRNAARLEFPAPAAII